ncbi:hypothetical protein J3R30DRAFT_103887 [Lentinula aciculospora]|uniref:Uncharacterized protein n=1 Tax=Lentinula aciculospora TaxID=153920 RepID=A0A9W9AU28_9AGAR|nr:hypothetical protein J3R30DRAFT_103887 [Lentinula aciculospora]
MQRLQSHQIPGVNIFHANIQRYKKISNRNRRKKKNKGFRRGLGEKRRVKGKAMGEVSFSGVFLNAFLNFISIHPQGSPLWYPSYLEIHPFCPIILKLCVCERETLCETLKTYSLLYSRYSFVRPLINYTYNCTYTTPTHTPTPTSYQLSWTTVDRTRQDQDPRNRLWTVVEIDGQFQRQTLNYPTLTFRRSSNAQTSNVRSFIRSFEEEEEEKEKKGQVSLISLYFFLPFLTAFRIFLSSFLAVLLSFLCTACVVYP